MFSIRLLLQPLPIVIEGSGSDGMQTSNSFTTVMSTVVIITAYLMRLVFFPQALMYWLVDVQP
ncbi:MAG: hypothetical protein F9K28_05115 [Bacteroidetes bacterium]|nr:MAG: hypothetical protein F9K28_05115 [Bacteroidota bacterium]